MDIRTTIVNSFCYKTLRLVGFLRSLLGLDVFIAIIFEIQSIHFQLMTHFYTPLKTENLRFCDVFGGIEVEH